MIYEKDLDRARNLLNEFSWCPKMVQNKGNRENT